MKDLLKQLFQHRTLSAQEAETILKTIAEGQQDPIQISAFLSVFNMRGITLPELEGFKKALLDLCVTVDLGTDPIIDMCGTGGDGKDTFNISTLASFVVAGAGAKVAKHGNYGVSSICGSSNVLNELGLIFTTDEKELQNQLNVANICFLHAPLFHPAMKKIAPIRRGLGLPTFFNILGPMINPAQPSHQLVGVYNLELARKYKYSYQKTNKNYVIIHGMDGYDEVSLTDRVKVIRNNTEMVMNPSDFGFDAIDPKALSGGKSVREAADIFTTILKGKGTDAQNNVVIANAAIAIQCVKNISYEESVAQAKDSLLSGKALKTLLTLIKN